MIPRIAISQAPYHRDLEFCLARTLDHMRQARQVGADLIVFPEWFLGLNPLEVLPNRHVELIAQAAQELSLAVVTGSLRALDPHTGKKQQRALVIDAEGRLVGSQAKCDFYPAERPWFEPGEGLTYMATRYGRLVLLMGLDALSAQRWEECKSKEPDLVVMATSPRTQRERASLQDLVLARSLEIGATVVLAPLMGRFAGITYVGGAVAGHKGRLVVDGGEGEKVVLATPGGAALIQLGVTDVSSWMPVAPMIPGHQAVSPEDLRGPEPERRVLLDWGAVTGADPLSIGRQLLAQAGESPRSVALAPAHPEHVRSMDVLLREGARGAYAWPGMARTGAWEKGYLEVGRLLAQYGRPLVVHAIPDVAPLRYHRPTDWDDVVLAYPSLPLILMGSGGRAPWTDEALALATLRPNVFLETSHAPVGFLKEAWLEIGPRRLLFGSGGLPIRFESEWEKLVKLRDIMRAPEDEFQMVSGLNARRLFFRELGRGALSDIATP